ncbi:MAG: heavy metal translocating P-type ATPase metal-binding domain-containing protein [Cyclobacteriaceae bacterium]|jgi:Cu+-exporting ATPase|nr:heavy metal translocating P-type ATPase metal-binding domain-containing protein [Flammeovirgaceae bacterium]MCZ8021324.1 heavy metal translocating P-type ATPase metal-binding domain-containing protein [Cytophagales bacterium]MCZ8327904.1 heavy metal translocating P-type ATPase metal-binding domain-containing protein [Cyclobacteriaceae bacterium]
MVETTVEKETEESLSCFHCGQPVRDSHVMLDNRYFCCRGCQTVYQILNDNNLCDYYQYEKHPGSTQNQSAGDFTFLDEPSIRKKILIFESADYAKAEFFVPAIHCISCLWLLENIQKICGGVIKSEVNFSAKRVTITYHPQQVALSAIANAMQVIGYPPQINLDTQPNKVTFNKSLIAKIAIAGFAFGNIMLLSFPEYLGMENNGGELNRLFSYLILALSVPVTFYSGNDYFINAWKSFKQKQLNIDVPIAIGLAALFLRSSYDIITHTGPGYMDSLSGLVFFLLIGRWFQDKTFESLAFDRDYQSYFPLSVQKRIAEGYKAILVLDLAPQDVIQIRNMEVIPTDAELLSDEACIDYSFVTGEARPSKVKKGETVFAGGRLLGTPVLLEVIKKTSQSHLTSLWNNEAFQKPKESKYKKIIDYAAQRFTWAVLLLTIVTGIFWYQHDREQMWLVITSVLMVACPCALALAAPFTYGNMMRKLGRFGLYLKNADVIERLAKADTIIFDKTGTITFGNAHIAWKGFAEEDELLNIQAITASSTHPLSMLIAKSLQSDSSITIEKIVEKPGKGIEAYVNGVVYQIGSADFVGTIKPTLQQASYVFVGINNEVRGYFEITTFIRSGLQQLISKLRNFTLGLLSGDNESDLKRMQTFFGKAAEMRFNQSPHDKLAYIQTLQNHHKTVVMLGDGLNDSGALKQSDIGIAVTDDTGVFTPACDGILQGDKLQYLDKIILLAKKSTRILKVAFAISFFYNIIALSFAVSGLLTPLVAAILMPISSVSVVGFATLAVNITSNKILKETS